MALDDNSGASASVNMGSHSLAVSGNNVNVLKTVGNFCCVFKHNVFMYRFWWITVLYICFRMTLLVFFKIILHKFPFFHPSLYCPLPVFVFGKQMNNWDHQDVTPVGFCFSKIQCLIALVLVTKSLAGF